MAIGRASIDLARLPRRVLRDGTGTVASAGREWRFQHVNVGNPQCVIEVGDEVEELDLGAIGPAIEADRAVPEPHQRLVHPGRRLDRAGADLRARGGGDPLVGHRRERRRGGRATCGGAESPITVRLDGGELTVEITDDLDVTLTGTAEPVYAGELSAELLARLAET